MCSCSAVRALSPKQDRLGIDADAEEVVWLLAQIGSLEVFVAEDLFALYEVERRQATCQSPADMRRTMGRGKISPPLTGNAAMT